MLLAWLWRDTIPTFAGVQPLGSQVHSGDGCTPASEPTSDIIGRRWLSPCNMTEEDVPGLKLPTECPETRCGMGVSVNEMTYVARHDFSIQILNMRTRPA